MKKVKSKRILAWMLTLAMILSVWSLPVFADDEKDIGEKGWVTVHPVDDPDPLKQSKLEITYEDNVIPPDSDVPPYSYSDVPEGAKIVLRYAFSFANGEEPNLHVYEDGQLFTINLPSGLNFPDNNGTLTIGGPSGSVLANWSITENVLQVVLTDEGGVLDWMDKWGWIQIEGTVNALGAGEPNEDIVVVFGEQEITIRRQDPPTDISLAKSGEYDAATNKITWTVTVTPPDANPDLSGYTLVDTYSDNQEYVTGSFMVGEDPIADTSLDLNVANTISYTFPADTAGEQIITYQTTPIDFSATGEGDDSKFVNTALLEDEGGEDVTGPVTADVDLQWIEKSGAVTPETEDDPYIVKWSIEVEVPGVNPLTNLRITDKLHEVLELLEDDGYPIQITFNEGSAQDVTTTPSTEAGHYSYDSSTGELVYHFPTGTAGGTKAVLTFYTALKGSERDDFLNDNDAISFTNEATLHWGTDDDLSKFPWIGSSTGPGIGGGGILDKAGTGDTNYNFKNGDIITWRIVVNRNGIDMTDVTIEDEIPAGLTLLLGDQNHPFTVSSGGSNIIINSDSPGFNHTDAEAGSLEKFTYVLGDIGRATYTITYRTRVTDEDLFYTNQDVSFTNNAMLTYNGDETVNKSGTKIFKSQMIAKSVAEAYDYETHLVQWKIEVNRNNLPLTNAKVSDTLPPGMVLVIDDDHEFEILNSANVAVGSYIVVNDGRSFEVTLPTPTDDSYTITYSYTITFWTKMTDEKLAEQWNTLEPFTNTAVLESEETNPSGITSSATINIRNPIVSKSGALEGNAIDWSVVINHAHLDLENAWVEDILHEHLLLLPESVKLYTVSITGSGTANMASMQEVDEGDYVVTLPTAENNNTLRVDLPDGPTAYVLEFSTVVLENTIRDLKNTVTLNGEGESEGYDGTSSGIDVENLYSDAFGGTNSLTVYKTGADGEALPGVTFRLLNADKRPITRNNTEITVTTGNDGKAVFENLPSWVFLVEEIGVPNGYVVPEDPYFYGERLEGAQEITVENDLARTNIEFTKTDTNGTPISGGRFQLTGTDFAGTPVEIDSKTNTNGTVRFEGVPVGEYTIKEVSPPSGYRITNEELRVKVEYEDPDNRTALEVTFLTEDGQVEDAPVLQNERTPRTSDPVGNISILKTDEDGDRLAGAEFTLYDSSGRAVGTAVSNSGGVAAFNDIAPGSYRIVETNPPEGYLVITREVEVTVGRNETVSLTILNEKGGELGDIDKPDESEDPKDPDDDTGLLPDGDGSTLPKTGDEMSLILWFALMLGALGAATVLIRKRRAEATKE